MEHQKVRVSFLKSTILGGALFLVPLVVLAYVIFTALGYMRMIAKPIVALLAVEVEQIEASQRRVVYIPGSPEFNSGSLALVEQSRVEVTSMTLLEFRQIMHRYGQKFTAGLSKGS